MLSPYSRALISAQLNVRPRAQIPTAEIATIGDGLNDVLMFEKSGMSIAVGNANQAVQQAAQFVTTSSEDEGFANAVERFVIGHQ